MRKGILLLIVMLLLSGCGFHIRNHQDLPATLQHLNIQAENPDEMVVVQLKALLESLPIQLTKSATYSLQLSKSKKSHSKANLSNSTQASYISYYQSIHVALVNNKTGKTVIEKTFSANIQQVLNQNQLMTAGTSALATQDLPHNLVTDIFLWLSTNQVRDALTNTKQTKYKKYKNSKH